MGYFSNGTEGDMYNGQYCQNCVNWRVNETETEGCPVIDLHMYYNYDQCGKTDKAKTIKSFLDFFIPRSKDGLSNAKCEMFLARTLNETANGTGS